MAANSAGGRRDAGLGGPVVDVHHHWLPRELVDHLEAYLPEGYRVVRAEGQPLRVYDPAGVQEMAVEPERYCSAAAQLADMDAAGIDVALLSASCFPTWMTLRAARLLNDAAADLQRAYPNRFVPMAHVPPFGEPGALAELERARKELGLRGVCIATNFQRRYPDEPEYRPFLRKAAELDIPVFVHAAGSPVHREGLLQYDLNRTLGRSMEHCLVTIRLLYSGVLEELPGLRLVMPHLGGAFFVNVKRFFHSPRALISEQPRVPAYERLLDQLLFDTAPSFWYGPTEIACAIANLGVRRVALGSDYPASWEPTVLHDAVEHVRALALAPAERALVAGGNAAAFYGLHFSA
ncbi:MAG TPA: amidohydrolase family protein [Chloroflexota bacterium]|nr:amidohydrolase family protein [Chloroflexota bacterium]